MASASPTSDSRLANAVVSGRHVVCLPSRCRILASPRPSPACVRGRCGVRRRTRPPFRHSAGSLDRRRVVGDDRRAGSRDARRTRGEEAVGTARGLDAVGLSRRRDRRNVRRVRQRLGRAYGLRRLPDSERSWRGIERGAATPGIVTPGMPPGGSARNWARTDVPHAPPARSLHPVLVVGRACGQPSHRRARPGAVNRVCGSVALPIRLKAGSAFLRSRAATASASKRKPVVRAPIASRVEDEPVLRA